MLLRSIASAFVLVAFGATAQESAPPQRGQSGVLGMQDPAPYRNQSGTINYAPRPAVYRVESIDAYGRIVRLRAANSAQFEVYVGEEIFDLAQLAPGERVRVDFLVPNEPSERLAAATIWPLR